ncbi:hypothetical protein GCM10008110_26670 [Marinobacter persicus]|nr:hypothetical protein GCM10008110_26670 [Marinobacter persicus]
MARNKRTGTVLVAVFGRGTLTLQYSETAVFGKGALIRKYSPNTSTDPQGKGKLRPNFPSWKRETHP